MTDIRTFLFMITGLIGGVLANLPLVAWMQGDDSSWMRRFPLSWIGVGMGTMSGFFHELGHTALFWFYGYIAVPMFDFQWGGGEALALTGQLNILLAALYAAIGYGLYLFRGERAIQAGLLALLAFNLATAFNDAHQAMIAFMGPGAQALVGGFMLYRAWMDLAPRGATERWLNAMIGSGMIVQVFIEGWNLIHNADYKDAYDHQKGGHDLGDFAKIADLMNLHFDTAVYAWLALAALCGIVPALLYVLRPGTYRGLST